MNSAILEMKHITKRFGKVTANQDINLSLYPGEIHALLGENGAGKSTLMNILTGIYKPNEGEIFYKGKKVSIRSPKHAVDLGIGMVHQHFRLIPTLTVAENVFLYSSNCKFILNKEKMEQSIAQCSQEFNLSVDAAAKVWQLSVGEQQRVEIVKLLYRGSEILVLDEPSAVLTPNEAKEMFRTLRKMADSGKSVILISHKMNEVMNYTDRITVLKGGVIEDSMPAKEATIERLTKAVIGDRTINKDDKIAAAAGTQKTILKVCHLSARNDKGLLALDNISLEIKAGQIFGIAGVAGNGQRELTEVIAGLRRADSGTIYLNNEAITNTSVKKCIKKGISFIPEDRLSMGLIPAMNLQDNAILRVYDEPAYSSNGIINKKSIKTLTDGFIQAFDIKTAGINTPIRLMSGGNQQKLLVAREINGNPSLIIAAYPVRGLDIGAAEAIHQILLEQRRKGAAILLVSEELDELFKMSDQIGVLSNGQIKGIKSIQDTTYEEIGKLMAGEDL